jgi:hypothetical protein
VQATAVRDHHGRVAVVELVGELAAGQLRVQRHGDGAELPGGVDRGHVDGMAAREDRDAAAALGAGVLETSGEAARQRVEVLERDGAVLAAQGVLLREPPRRGLHRRREVHRCSGSWIMMVALSSGIGRP